MLFLFSFIFYFLGVLAACKHDAPFRVRHKKAKPTRAGLESKLQNVSEISYKIKIVYMIKIFLKSII